jgi:hypothetical protein
MSNRKKIKLNIRFNKDKVICAKFTSDYTSIVEGIIANS